jgi:ABC-type lipoprotein release transport system permease subunit
MIFKIALRNILRHKRRTLSSALTIAVGVAVFIALNSIMSGMDSGAIRNMVHLSTGAVRITTRQYEEEKQTFPLNFGIDNPLRMQNALRKDPRIMAVAPRTQFLGQLSNGTENIPIGGIIVDPAADTLVFELHKNVSGAFFSAHSEREILIGSRLARDLKVNRGDYITLFALTKYDSRNADEFLVAGLVNSTDPGLNKNGVFITYKAAEDFLDLEGVVTELDVAVAQKKSLHAFMKDAGEVTADIKGKYPDLSASSFLEIGAAFFQMSKTKSLFGFVLMGVILLIAGIGIFNTVFMSVYERIREIGVLRAHGMKRNQITALFLLEGIITGIAGAGMGLLLGSLFNVYLTDVGLSLDKMAGNIDTAGMPFWGTIYGTWNYGSLAFVFIFSVAAATLAAVIPARSAGRFQVTKALRFN